MNKLVELKLDCKQKRIDLLVLLINRKIEELRIAHITGNNIEGIRKELRELRLEAAQEFNSRKKLNTNAKAHV